jgi:hypothetical protein
MISAKPAIGALIVLAALWSSSGAAETCLSRGDGRQLIVQGKIAKLPDALRRAGVSLTQVLEVKLCPAGGGFVYRVKVLQPGGRVRAVNVPAN